MRLKSKSNKLMRRHTLIMNNNEHNNWDDLTQHEEKILKKVFDI